MDDLQAPPPAYDGDGQPSTASSSSSSARPTVPPPPTGRNADDAFNTGWPKDEQLKKSGWATTSTAATAADDYEQEMGTSYLPAPGRSQHKSGYTALAGGDNAAATTSGRRGSVDGVGRDDFPVMKREGCSVVADADAEWLQDSESLYRFLLAERPILPPTISLRFTFYRNRGGQDLVSVPFESAHESLFSFTVPIHLPSMSKAAGSDARILASQGPAQELSTGPGLLRVMQDGAPCFRAQSLLNGGLLYESGLSVNARTLRDDTTAQMNAPLHSRDPSAEAGDAEQHGRPRTATVKVPQQLADMWNKSRKKGSREPWRPPMMRVDQPDDDGGEANSSPARHAAAVRAALADFLQAENRSAHILVCDHIPYGWDLQALAEAVKKNIVDKLQARNFWSTAGIFSSGPAIDHVVITYERIPPWLDLQVRKGPYKTYDMLMGVATDAGAKRSASDQATVGYTVLFAGMFLTGFCIWGAAGSDRSMSSWGFYTMLASLIGAGPLAVACMNIGRAKVSDTIILGHPLKLWQPTGCPASYSHDEVLDELLGEKRRQEDDARGKVHLSRRDDGWYVLKGLREGDWLREHMDFLTSAVKERKAGDLTSDLYDYQSRRPEGEDSETGL